ncbi:MAG: protein kinase domain-containing protein [Armatimonadota bacterium]
MTGTVLKYRYEVQEKIGEGSLFTVYKCEDKINNRTVAVKVLLPQHASNRLFAERILVEAQAMVGVSHPGIVEVLDCGEEAGTYFVILEYVRGTDLTERIRRSAPFTLTTSVDLGLAVADVLDFAHKRGFVHGDLRPNNILVTAEGQIKLTDFWVTPAVLSSHSLRTNALMRSVHYTAPENAEGKAPTPASDIYSLGTILFQMLTGCLPFDGDTPIAIAMKHARDPVPSIRAVNPGVPKTLEALVVRAMQKDPAERFRSAQALAGELKSAREALHLEKPLVWSNVVEKPEPLSDEPEEEEPVFLSSVRRVLIGLLILAAVGVAVIAYSVWSVPPEVSLPDLTGRTVSEAEEILSQNKIHLSVRSEQFNEDYEEGVVYYMSPGPGRTIRSGKTVDVWVSKGSKYAKVPHVVGLTLEEARQRILDADLAVGQVSQDYSEEIPAGSIMNQSPASGDRISRGQPVSIVFSLGPRSTDLPLPATSNTAQSEPRSFEVNFEVPSGRQDQAVEVRVEDANGESTVYSEIKHPGDTVEQTVTGTGDKIIIRVFIDGKLAREDVR